MPTLNQQSIHMNSNILCAVSIHTTGMKPNYHELCQICVMPLTSVFKPLESPMPFIADIIPRYNERIDRDDMPISHERMIHIMKHGLEHYTSGEMFLEWHAKLPLNFRKKLIPLAYNWPDTKPFVSEWLGPINMSNCFADSYRDILSTANYLNDYYDWHIENCPFPKTNFQYLASCAKIERIKPFEPITDCLAIGQIYKHMVDASILNKQGFSPIIAK